MFGLGWFLVMAILAGLKFLTYQRLKQRRSRVFCMVVAGLSCFGVPYDTMLSMFTFVALARPSVVKLFETPALPVQSQSTGPSGG